MRTILLIGIAWTISFGVYAQAIQAESTKEKNFSCLKTEIRNRIWQQETDYFSQEMNLTSAEKKWLFPRYKAYKDSLFLFHHLIMEMYSQADIKSIQGLSEEEASRYWAILKNIYQREWMSKKQFHRDVEKRLGEVVLLQLLYCEKKFHRMMLLSRSLRSL